MVTVKQLKEIIKNLPDNMVVFSSEEGNEYPIELNNIYVCTKEEIIFDALSQDYSIEEIEDEYKNGTLLIG